MTPCTLPPPPIHFHLSLPFVCRLWASFKFMWQHSLLSQFELILSVTLYTTISNAFLITACIPSIVLPPPFYLVFRLKTLNSAWHFSSLKVTVSSVLTRDFVLILQLFWNDWYHERKDLESYLWQSIAFIFLSHMCYYGWASNFGEIPSHSRMHEFGPSILKAIDFLNIPFLCFKPSEYFFKPTHKFWRYFKCLIYHRFSRNGFWVNEMNTINKSVSHSYFPQSVPFPHSKKQWTVFRKSSLLVEDGCTIIHSFTSHVYWGFILTRHCASLWGYCSE